MDLLVNDQTIPKIMGKMPFTDWKEWATKRPEWIRGDLEMAFEVYVERKWKDALNVAAAEPQAWEADTAKRDRGYQEKPAWGKPSGEKLTRIVRKSTRLAGAANVVTYQSPSKGRRCKFQDFTGCSGNHAAAFCSKLRVLDPETKQRALAACGLCLFCLRHLTGTECYGRGRQSKPACPIPEYGEKHAANVHDVFMEASASVSLVRGGWVIRT